MKLISVNVGLPREVEWRGGMVTTGIFKQPVDGHRLRERGLGYSENRAFRKNQDARLRSEMTTGRFAPRPLCQEQCEASRVRPRALFTAKQKQIPHRHSRKARLGSG